MAKTVRELLEETKKLTKKNKQLQQQLLEAKGSIDAIKTGNIDALIFADEHDLKVYTEKTSDKIYRVLVEKMHEGAVTINEDRVILYANSYFAGMVNLPLQKVIGVKFETFIDKASRDQLGIFLHQSAERAVKEEFLIHSVDGHAIPVLLSVNPLVLDNSVILSIILTDLTIQKKNEVELKQRTKELEQKNAELEIANSDLTSFTYVSSHDLQEPLRKIQLFVSCLLDEEKDNLTDQGKDHLQRTAATAKRMRTLIDDLLTYSRAKNIDHKFEATDLKLIIDQICDHLKEEMVEQKATLEVVSLCEVNIIRYQFYQLFHNLINNSLKFAKADTPSRIVIKSELIEGTSLGNETPPIPPNKLSSLTRYCHITYTDNGIGFDPQYKDRIFELFQRLHTRQEYKGTGIGLSICKRVIENHKGTITATGEINKGVTFNIYLPIS